MMAACLRDDRDFPFLAEDTDFARFDMPAPNARNGLEKEWGLLGVRAGLGQSQTLTESRLSIGTELVVKGT